MPHVITPIPQFTDPTIVPDTSGTIISQTIAVGIAQSLANKLQYVSGTFFGGSSGTGVVTSQVTFDNTVEFVEGVQFNSAVVALGAIDVLGATELLGGTTLAGTVVVDSALTVVNGLTVGGQIVGSAGLKINGTTSLTGSVGLTGDIHLGGAVYAPSGVVAGFDITTTGQLFSSQTGGSPGLLTSGNGVIEGTLIVEGAVTETYQSLIRENTSPVAVDNSHRLYLLDLTSFTVVAMIVNLPAVTDGRVVEFVVSKLTSGTATLTCNGSDTFVQTGSGTLTLSTGRAYVKCIGSTSPTAGWLVCITTT
jgi:hypothetical protein